jgi:hypothetical protein
MDYAQPLYGMCLFLLEAARNDGKKEQSVINLI